MFELIGRLLRLCLFLASMAVICVITYHLFMKGKDAVDEMKVEQVEPVKTESDD